MAKKWGKQKQSRPPPEEELEEEDSDDGLASEEVDSDDAGAPMAVPGKGGSKRPAREAIYDVDAMHEKLEDIGWADGAPWDETLAITHDDPKEVEDVDDDMARELAFYNQALAGAQEAIRRFDAAGTPWLRPPDYYAEMVKTDQHMAKVKEQLMFEQRQIEQAEERRKMRENKQYSKQVQAEKQKERAAAKKRQIESVSNLRKQREKSGFAGELDYDKEMGAMERRGGQSPKQGGGKFRDRGAPAKGKGPMNRARAVKDAKFGFGGAKRLKKQNNAESAADMGGFRPQSRGKGPGGPRGGGGFQGKGKPGPGGPKKTAMKRPGKAARANKAGGKGFKGGKGGRH